MNWPTIKLLEEHYYLCFNVGDFIDVLQDMYACEMSLTKNAYNISIENYDIEQNPTLMHDLT